MPANTAEQILDALKALLQTVPDALVERNSGLAEKVQDGGLIILRDGDPGEPEQPLGGFGTPTISMRSRSRSSSRRAMQRHVTLPSMPSSSSSVLRSTNIEGVPGAPAIKDRDAHRDRRLRERCSPVLKCQEEWGRPVWRGSCRMRSSRCRESARQ
jgi:hypothetical protein